MFAAFLYVKMSLQFKNVAVGIAVIKKKTLKLAENAANSCKKKIPNNKIRNNYWFNLL